MTTPELAFTAGTAAGGLAILITTKVVKKLRSEWTAEGRAQALHELFLEVEKRHKRVLEALPEIEQTYLDEQVFQNVQKTTKLLRAYDYSLTFLDPASILTYPTQRRATEGWHNGGGFSLRGLPLVSVVQEKGDHRNNETIAAGGPRNLGLSLTCDGTGEPRITSPPEILHANRTTTSW